MRFWLCVACLLLLPATVHAQTYGEAVPLPAGAGAGVNVPPSETRTPPDALTNSLVGAGIVIGLVEILFSERCNQLNLCIEVGPAHAKGDTRIDTLKRGLLKGAGIAVISKAILWLNANHKWYALLAASANVGFQMLLAINAWQHNAEPAR